MKTVEWARACLASRGYTINNTPEYIQTTPWSSVMRFLTSTDDYIYLKQTPPMLSLEPTITQILYEQFHASVPIIIDTNKELNCFLMQDSGNPLRQFFKSNFQPNLLCEGIKQYGFIQYAAAEHINIFLDLGVPDWRLEKLPSVYIQLISQEELLIQDGLTADELGVLHKLYPRFSSVCESLFSYKILETLDHCDFHDNNILIENDTNKMTIIDWGESVVTHPFFSLISCLRDTTFRYHLKEVDKILLELQTACFACGLFDSKSKENLLAAILLAQRLWPIYSALGNHRLIMASDIKEFKTSSENRTLSGRMARAFKEFLRREG